jgi:hypothetical protein
MKLRRYQPGAMSSNRNEVFVELLDRTFERQGVAGLLQPLQEIGGSSEANAVAIFDQGVAEGREMRPSGGARSDEQDRAAMADPAVTAGPGRYMRAAERGPPARIARGLPPAPSPRAIRSGPAAPWQMCRMLTLPARPLASTSYTMR